MTESHDSGLEFVSCDLCYTTHKPSFDKDPNTLQSQTPLPIIINGKRVKTIDVHAHCQVSAALELVKGRPEVAGVTLAGADFSRVENIPSRLKDMDAMGIDMQALSITVFQHFHWAEKELASEIARIQNEKLSEICGEYPDRFVALGTVSLQHPELATEQLEYSVRKLYHRGVMITASVNDDELSNPKFNQFWAKAEELEAVVLIHPQHFKAATKRFEGRGFLSNIIGNPLDTTVALAHLIYEGVLDQHPNLKVIGAHGGGLLPSYIGRYDHGHNSNDRGGRGLEKKKPSEYLTQLYFDSLVYSTENLKHLINECGVSQIVLGTDHPAGMANINPIAHLLSINGLSDDDIEAICNGNLRKLLKINT